MKSHFKLLQLFMGMFLRSNDIVAKEVANSPQWKTDGSKKKHIKEIINKNSRFQTA